MIPFAHMQTPLILTACLSEEAQSFFNQQRKRYFPPERNFIEAHLTLFHHLPDEDNTITQTIEALCLQQKRIELSVTEPRGIGKGVAYKIESKVLISLHKKLQQEWREKLTMQDRQGLWPHITIQNKVTPDEAKQTLTQIEESFVPFTAYATGLILWRYLNGPWQVYRSFPFAG